MVRGTGYGGVVTRLSKVMVVGEWWVGVLC